MYLRDTIKIGGASNSFSGIATHINYTNSVISDIKKGNKNTLVLHLAKKESNLTGHARIRSKDNKNAGTLEKILFSKKIYGKTLKELRDFELDSL